MQRAISYISLFLSDFDIEDPDHDLAGFCDGGDYERRQVASVDSVMSTQHMAVSMSGTHITASMSGTHASDSYDRVFELPNFELSHGQRIEEEGEEEVEGEGGREVVLIRAQVPVECVYRSKVICIESLYSSRAVVFAQAGPCPEVPAA